MTGFETFIRFLEDELAHLGISLVLTPSGKIGIHPPGRADSEFRLLLSEFKPEIIEWLKTSPSDPVIVGETDPLKILQAMRFGAVIQNWNPGLGWEWLRQLYGPALGGIVILEEPGEVLRFELPPSGSKNVQAVLGAAHALEVARPFILEHRVELEALGLIRVVIHTPKPTEALKAPRWAIPTPIPTRVGGEIPQSVEVGRHD